MALEKEKQAQEKTNEEMKDGNDEGPMSPDHRRGGSRETSPDSD